MNILYKQTLKIKNRSIKVIIVTISLFLSIIIIGYSFVLIENFIEEKNILNLSFYASSIYLSYFFWGFLRLIMYSETYNIKINILKKIKEEYITEWTYTIDESKRFRESYNNSIKKDRKQIFILISAIISVPIIISFFSFGIDKVHKIFNSIIPFIIISQCLEKDLNSFKRALKKENVTIVFSKIGFVVSESYTNPFYIKLKKLESIKYDKTNNKIFFTQREIIPSTDNVDSVYYLIDEIPVPKRYQMEAEKIIREIYN